MTKIVQVKVDDGNSMPCLAEIPLAVWSVQGFQFHSNLKFLPLGSFDIILGMDWLEAFSPMKVHWADKWISIPYGNRQILLQGLPPEQPSGQLLQFLHVACADDDTTTTVCLEIQSLLDQFSVLFAMPQGLPPRRQCDHKIPLVPGAQPVAVRPYRYAPNLKSEIEQQVSEMLDSGLIQPSTILLLPYVTSPQERWVLEVLR